MEGDTVYAVERHDDSWHGATRIQIARDIEGALELAEQERDEHRGSEWELSSSSEAHIRFRPTDSTNGCVRIIEKPLH